MSRIRKLSDSEQISMRKLKYRTPSSKIMPSQYSGKNPYSPYKDSKLTRSPSYVMMQNNKHLYRSGSLSRCRNRDSKVLNKIDETSLSAARSNPWEQFLFHAKVLKEKLNAIEKGDCEKAHEKFIELFDEVIEKDLIFGSILGKIKESYTEIIQNLANDAKMLVKEIEKINEEKGNFEKMLERLAKENRDLGKEVQKMDSKYVGLQKVVKGIQQVDLEDVPLDSEKWRGLIYENGEYCNLIYELRVDLKEYQYKEKKLLELIAAIKNSGVDIDSIFEKEFRDESNMTFDYTNELTAKELKMPSLELSKIIKSD